MSDDLLTQEEIAAELDIFRLTGIALKLFRVVNEIATMHIEQRESVPVARMYNLKDKARRALEYGG